MNAQKIEAERWLKQAKADLAVAQTLLSTEHYAAACFHAQQGAEKALKSVLMANGQRLVWGHSVRDLAMQCETYDPSFAELAEVGSLLDQFYIPTRYPNGLPSPAVPSENFTRSQASVAKDMAEKVLQKVEFFCPRPLINAK